MENANDAERGRWIYAAWKHLRRYDATAVGLMSATAYAGRAGDLLGRVRMLKWYSLRNLQVLALDAGIGQIELETLTIPRLEATGAIQVRRDQEGSVTGVVPLVLGETDVLGQIAAVWDTLDATAEETGALEVLRAGGELPRTRDELLERCLGTGLNEDESERAIERAVAVGLVKLRHAAEAGVDLYFNEYLWGDNITRTADAIARLPTTVKESLVSMLAELHESEGRPVERIESASPDLVRFAVENGLIEQTQIVTTDGRTASFSFTPRLKGFGIAKEDLPDELDQIRLVIASFSFAQHHATNRLDDPVTFLSVLIDNGRAGSAEPIATDYGALQKQQIVGVEPIFNGARNHRFRVIKEDSLVAARDTMLAGEVVSRTSTSGGAGLLASRDFRDPVATRVALGRQQGPAPLHQDVLLAAVRDAAQRSRPRPGQ